MYEIWTQIWEFKYAMVPCVLSYAVFDLPIIVRRITRKAYVPIYFPFLPTGYSDEITSKYFDEDDFYLFGGPPQSKREEDWLRARIVILSTFSFLLTIILSPLLFTIFANEFLTAEEYNQAWWTLVAFKITLLTKAIYDLNVTYMVAARISNKLLVSCYAVYLGAIVFNLDQMKTWVDKTLPETGYRGLTTSAFEFLLTDLLYGILIPSIISFCIAVYFTGKEASFGEADPE